MNFSIKAIIFDFGGVLINWDPRNLFRHFFTNSQEMENFLREIDFYSWNSEQDKGRSFEEGIAQLSAQFPHYSKLISSYYERWEESLDGPITATIEILYTLKNNNYSLYGLSNWSAETYPRVREKFSFFELFDDIIISGNVKLNKPDPSIFNLFLARNGYTASECIFIDDSPPNIDTAKDLGFITIHFTSPIKLRVSLEQIGVIFNSNRRPDESAKIIR